MATEKGKQQDNQEPQNNPSETKGKKIPSYQEINVNKAETYYKRCCGMCGGGLNGNPCWKEEGDIFE
jgi:hypothetical protein